MLFPFSFMQSQVDPDAAAFFARVTAAGGTLTATEQSAVNTLVVTLKANSLWTPMKAIYPMVGASAAACAQNLKSSSFTGTFTSGWTFASTGATPNGTSAFMDTALTASVSLSSINNLHLSFYSRTQNTTTGGWNMGVDTSTPNTGFVNLGQYFAAVSQKLFNNGFYPTYAVTSTQTNTRGLVIGVAESSVLRKLHFNGSLLATTTTTTISILPSSSFYVGSGRNSTTGNAADFSPHECSLASIGDGLTDTQASNFYTAVQTFNQTLNRQVGAQIVSDADAQAYIDRVYTAGGTLTNTEANAVNQLTIDMKAAGIWTAMKAVYPMVGSSAAACAQNLKSSSFTGTFSSGWTFASTGVTPNGTSAYFDSNLNQSGNLTPSNNHISVYSRTNFNGSTGFSPMDCGITNNTSYSFQIISPRSNDLALYENGTHSISVSNTNSQGLFIGTSTSSTSAKFYKNGSSIGISTTTQTRTMFANNVYFGASNISTTNSPAYFSARENAFASIGDGLTDTQSLNLYTAVQTFQTTLSRQV